MTAMTTLAIAANVESQLPAPPAVQSEGAVIRGQVDLAGAGSSRLDLSNFVISVEDIEGSFPPSTEHAVLDQKNLEFVPHVLVIQAGTTVEFPNSDPVLHNVFSISKPKRFNLGLYRRNTRRQITFESPGVVELLCNVHLEMSAYIVVCKNPYFALTRPDGSYVIAGVPAGRHRVRCWHEDYKSTEQQIDVPRKGEVTVNFSMQQ